MTELEKKLGYTFKNPELLNEALTHSSYANEHRQSGARCNERLEFLGDSVLGFIVAEYLYIRYPDLPEGKMTRLRADLVCEGALAAVAARLGLGDELLLGIGEERTGGRKRNSVIADATEALFAAVYLDGGVEEIKTIIYRYILADFELEEHAEADYKTQLQEYVQKTPGQELSYVEIGETGPDHEKQFTVSVVLNGKSISEGSGKSKKAAEQAAARLALERLK